MVIDTSIFIDFLRSKDKSQTYLQKISFSGNYYISVITLFELFIGATSPAKWKDVEILLDGIIVIPMEKEISIKSAQIYQNLKKENRLIDFRDIFIGATAIIHNIPLFTLNIKHFDRIEGIKLINL